MGDLPSTGHPGERRLAKPPRGKYCFKVSKQRIISSIKGRATQLSHQACKKQISKAFVIVIRVYLNNADCSLALKYSGNINLTDGDENEELRVDI